MAQSNKNRLKRQSLNHQYKELSRTHQDIVDVPVELLTDSAWKPDREADIQMFLSVPGITSKEQLPGELRNLTLALIADRFPHTVWTHVYTDGSAEEGMKNVLQSCPKYTERRQLTWPQGAGLATKLWGSAEDLYRTAGFVASTGLKI